jgi:pimeloyl-ACP methyl ester carboxylesterase
VRTTSAVLFFILPLFFPSSSVGQDSAAEQWRYSLRPGDHLIYSERIHRVTESSSTRSEVELSFSTHVLAVADVSNGVAVGTQRNRQDAKLISYRENGKDKLASEQGEFLKRLAKNPNQWSEANWFSRTGTPELPWAAVRESSSRLLAGVHEIESLPSDAVKPGDQWRSDNPLGFQLHYSRPEEVNGALCRLVQGDAGQIHLRYWFCPSIGAIAKLELEGDQLTFAGKVHELVTLELHEIRHIETLKQWIGSTDTRLALLRTVLITRSINISPGDLADALASDNADAQVLALAILRSRSLPLTKNVAESLAKSSDPRMQRMSAGLSGQSGEKSTECTRPTRDVLPLQVPGTTIHYSQNPRSRGDLYLLHVPEEYSTEGEGFPLIVYLSGGPGLAIDGANGAENLIAKSNYLVLYPNAEGRMWWARGQPERVEALLEEALEQLNVDRSRVYVIGFSNGGTGALYYATLWPERFSAIAALMGGAACMDELRPLAMRRLAGLPVLLVHGDHDSIIPHECSESAFKDIRKISPDSELHILKGREHDVVLGSDEGLTTSFLEKHSRCTLKNSKAN